jgi:four helix bundle protein
MSVQKYTELVAWQKAMTLVQEVYQVAQRLPAEERFGLAAQLRKAAVSIPANIAEGQGRKSSSEFRYHLSVAIGSLHELETEVMVAGRLSYAEESEVAALLEHSGEVGRLVHGLYRSLPKRRVTDHRPLTTDHRPLTTDH